MSDEIDRSTLRLPFAKGQWVDADEMIFQACFAVLGEYVENELGREPWDFGDGPCADSMYRGYRLHSADIGEDDPIGVPARPSSDRHAIDLWLWYQQELPELETAYAQDLSEVYSQGIEFGKPDERGLVPAIITRTRDPKFPHDFPEKVKDEKLRELIDTRRTLWT